LVFLVTLGATVLFDLIMAVQVGVAVAAVLALRAMARTSGVHREDVPLPAEVDSETEQRLLREHIAVYRIDGAWFFGDARRFLEELTGIADVRVVILRLSGLQVLDTSGAAALVDII